jgi:hypothetical protein
MPFFSLGGVYRMQLVQYPTGISGISLVQVKIDQSQFCA